MRVSSTIRKQSIDPHLRKFGGKYDAAMKQLNRLRTRSRENPMDCKLLQDLEEQELKSSKLLRAGPYIMQSEHITTKFRPVL